MSGKLKPATHTKKNERIGRANRTDTDAVRFGNTELRGLGNLNAPFLPGATGDRQDAFPLADLIDRPGLRLILVERIRVLAGRIEVDRLRKPFVQHVIQQAIGRKPFAVQSNLGKEVENLVGILNGDRLHLIGG